MKNRTPSIAVDFDGVIHKYRKGWQGGLIYDVPIEGAIEALDLLKAKGYKIIIFTTRDDIESVKVWFNQRGRDFEVTNKKPLAIAYIDDRAIRFTNWKDILNYF